MKYLVKSEDENILLTNCGGVLIKSHERIFINGDKKYILFLEVEDKSEKKSTRIRKTFFDILEKTLINFLDFEQEKFNKYNHIIQTISTQTSQKLEGYFGDKKWYGSSYMETLDNIESVYLSDKDETRRLVHYFNKASIDLKNHIEGWEIIYIKTSYKPEFNDVSLKKAILNQFSSFSEEFEEMGISIKFSDHFSDECIVSLDKKLFSLIMYNFFSNALKYSKQGESIRLNYDEETNSLDISMYSVKIEKIEIEKIFEDGVRGINANKVSSSGYGLGLFAIKKALHLMSMNNMYIRPTYAKTKTDKEVTFIENHFQFHFKINS